MGGEVAADGQRLAVDLVGVGEAAGVLVEDSEIVKRASDRWQVRAGVMGGDVAIDGQRLAEGLVGVGEAAGVLVEDSEIVKHGGDRGWYAPG